MKKVLLLILVMVAVSLAQNKVINGSADYSFGDDETVVSAKEKCKKMAISNAVSSFATYIKSETEIKNFVLQNDLIIAKSVALVRNIIVVDEKVNRQNSTIHFVIKAEINEKEVIEELKKISNKANNKAVKEVDYQELIERDSVFYYQDEKKPFSGVAVEYFGDNKTKKAVREIKNGKRHGKVTTYFFSNGNVEFSTNFFDGKRHGKLAKYYENGQINATSNFKNGELHGKTTIYYTNGLLQGEVDFIDGKENGKSFEYYENGQVKEQNSYKNGRRHGEQVSHFESGQVERRSNYKDGKQHGAMITYYENGLVFITEHYREEKLHGECYLYDEYGQLLNKTKYINGVEQK